MSTATAGYTIVDNATVIGEMPRQYELRVKDLQDSDKPREKLQQAGPTNLGVAELLAVIWGVGSKREDVLQMARRTVQEYGEKAIANETNAAQLAKIADIPLSKAAQVIAAFELGRRYYATSAGRPVYVRNARHAFLYLKPMGHLQKEQLRGLYLNSRYQVIHDEVISVGSLTSNIVHPREVFRPAIEHGAAAVIIAHNHPSGVLRPTLADIDVTEQLRATGEVLGIELLDHIIIAGEKHVSIYEEEHA